MYNGNYGPSSVAAVQKLREEYPTGTRVFLQHMDDPRAVKTGTRGTVLYVDDFGMLNVQWDDGRRLGLIPGVDRFRALTEAERKDPGEPSKEELDVFKDEVRRTPWLSSLAYFPEDAGEPVDRENGEALE